MRLYSPLSLSLSPRALTTIPIDHSHQPAIDHTNLFPAEQGRRRRTSHTVRRKQTDTTDRLTRP